MNPGIFKVKIPRIASWTPQGIQFTRGILSFKDSETDPIRNQRYLDFLNKVKPKEFHNIVSNHGYR